MRRRSKEGKDAAPDGEGPSEAPPQDEPVDPLDERIQPLEEFRAKSDQWMKETSAQLARVATHAQQDEKRQQKLDERLAEFEERIQAMLTLTEALTQEDNPFVRSQSADPPSAAPRSRDERLALSDEENAGPAWAEEEGQAAESLVPVSDDRPAGPGSAEDLPHRAASPASRHQAHPNDAAAERSDAEYDGAAFDEAEEPELLDDSPRLDPGAAREAEERLLLLQWASLLARHMHRIDVDAFLETYLTTRWVTPAEVEKVRALAVDLARHANAPAERLTREDLHIRSILLLSRLSTRDERGGRRARKLVDDTRTIADAPWMRAER